MSWGINIREATRKIEVDHRIPLKFYYKTADNLLKQANIYRQENNIIDLYILLLRYAGIIAETIPFHRDYSASNHTEKISYKKKLLDVLRELECLRPQVEREINKVNREHALKEQIRLNNASSSRQSPHSRMASLWPDNKQTRHSRLTLTIPRPANPEVVPSAPPIENLIIDDDAPLQSGSAESSFVDSSSSTTENLSKRQDEGSSNAASSCIICYEAPIEGACVPCGHMAGCMSCLNEIKAKSWGCPVCRTKIELVLRLYAV
ncbi:AMSH-like ubiquitin thioesterase 3 [Lycium barbarum]|uniref:AMSH-like ubiquitin thioesterase 3 n=1 Tax=Lycium barbarum TaxID=112863 RepID=UPI00293F1494|nr:AMSH-like ubiquitin thioesterase 3 [Lycium barbarum]